MGARVLIIEDIPDNLELMSYLLGAFGHHVLSAVDGAEGVEAARREHPDLIVCDVHLPGMDGYEVARHLKSDPELRLVPLVAVTALAMVGDRDRVLASGFDGYVAKPINPETFVGQMEAFLEAGHRLARPAGRHATATAPAGEAAWALPVRMRGQTILVVDNLPVNLELARSILEPSGYRTITASGAAEALDLARSDRCDMILSDVRMADGTGFDFARAVRADPALRGIPFVFITSTDIGDAARAQGMSLGAARFIIRPIEPELLLREIAACLGEIART